MSRNKVIAAITAVAVVFAAYNVVSARNDWLALRDAAPRIVTIDYYGLRKVTIQQIQSRLEFKEGDPAPIPVENPGFFMKVVRPLSGVTTSQSVEALLRKISGVVEASVATISGEDPHKAAVFVGIAETVSRSRFSAPNGASSLPDSIASLYDQHIQAFNAAMAAQNPNFDEDESEGHALFTDLKMRALENKAIELDRTQENISKVRLVLRTATDPRQRRSAAWLITYAPDKRVVVEDLVSPSHDPDSEVRNIAVRSLILIAEFVNKHPDLEIHIPASSFIEMLNSIIWTDRNKATGVMYALTETRDAAVLKQLRLQALPELVEMARWKDGHAQDSFMLIGRIAGLSDVEIENAWNDGSAKRQEIIQLANQAPLN